MFIIVKVGTRCKDVSLETDNLIEEIRQDDPVFCLQSSSSNGQMTVSDSINSINQASMY